MKQDDILNLVAAVKQTMHGAASRAKESTHKLIDQHILAENYVTREEFEATKALLIKLTEEIQTLKSNKKLKK